MQIILSLKQVRLKKQVEEFDSEIVKVSISNQETVKYLKYFKVKNIKFFGNLKFVQNKNKNLSLPTKIQNIILSKKTWCASSTHEGEELICIKVHKNLKNKYKNFFSIIIPRHIDSCLLYTSPSPRDRSLSRMPSSA